MSSLPSFQDQRVAEAAERLAQGDIRLLSLDIFDTLLARRLPRPPDLFLRMGILLQTEGKLLNGQTPDSFAALRYQCEYDARGLRQKAHGDREIHIGEIYDLFPPHITSASKEPLIALEVSCESEAAFANRDIIALAGFAKAQGIKIALVSNMYMGEALLRPLVARHAPDLPSVDGWFVSSDHRMGKRTGLLLKMCEQFGVTPQQVLHSGDNPVSDRLAAQEINMPFLDLGFDPLFEKSLIDEQPRQWRDRAQTYASLKDGDRGMTFLRRQALFRKGLAPPHRLYGYRMMGPLLTGFAGWAAERAAQEKAPMLFGLLREGDFLTRLVGLHSPAPPCALLATSRLTAALACFTPDRPAYLEDFLTRRGFWTLEMLLAQLGFTTQEAREIGDPAATLEHIPPHELTTKLMASSLAPRLYARSKERRDRLIKHLGGIGALDNDRLHLLDLGYAATIQRALQRVFAIEGIKITTHGFYLATAHVSRFTQEEGGIVEGFLAQNGNPNDFACAFCRCPEIVELACMPAYGTVTDYDTGGQPLFEKNATAERQIQETFQMQQGIETFAHDFVALNKTQKNASPFTHESWRLQMRDLARRLVVYPTAKEAALMGHWLADSDMGLASPRPIVSAGPHQSRLPHLTAPELAALPRRDVPWLFGVAAAQNHALARQVARIIQQHERPEAFTPLCPAPLGETL